MLDDVPAMKDAGKLGGYPAPTTSKSWLTKTVVGPVDADVVDLISTVAQLDDTVDDAARVGGQCGFGRRVRRRSADDRS